MGGEWHLKTLYDFTNHWDQTMSQAIVDKDVRVSVYHFDGVRLEHLCGPTTDPKEMSGAIRNVPAPIYGDDLTPSQRQGLAVALAAASTTGASDRALAQLFHTGGRTRAASGKAIPLELPPGRQVLPPEGWPGTGHRGWPLEAAIGTLEDSAAAPDKALRMLVTFSMGIGGTTTVPEDVADRAVALGIPIYPVVMGYQMNNGGRGRSGDGGDQPYPLRLQFMDAFRSLGKLTGDRSFDAADMRAGDVRDFLEIVRNEGLVRARSQYNVGFVPPSSRAAREHKLEIRLASKSSGKLIGGKRRAIY